MTETEFNDLIDDTLAALEVALDAVDDDIEYEMAGGVLTVEFDNDTSMIFSRQRPTCQLWLATRSGGYHFTYDADAGDWRDTRGGHLLRPFVVSEMRSQAGVDCNWE